MNSWQRLATLLQPRKVVSARYVPSWLEQQLAGILLDNFGASAFLVGGNGGAYWGGVGQS